ncbi:Nucleotide-binding oligomerization domain-containing protein 2 [Holothuria leucospilota]|uniref:Nucleotide-binding oligomerization domain-containing protein 2 n=1 Tax=Holothuria leucospilota TaxID=206669 RepID=A0A9Q1CQQ1_HOLLE|nr:Nucleotide-binding oligomerization domain-containing protein 2 [Holothuria leucospilota]
MSNCFIFTEILDTLLKDLKKTYQRLAKTVRPVPYSSAWCCVGDIFVESKLEVMKQTKFKFEREQWKPVSSYRDVVCDDAQRLLLDGDPGFGKSTLALQLAYEWCLALDGCPLNKINIFILIRLREVRNIKSISRVIKLLLLPRESRLKEEDIQEILAVPHLKIVFIMDGFDEFSLGGEDCDVSSIIKGEMYSDRKVVITTRPDCTQSLLGFVEKRMRLSGFDERIQDIYIRKVVSLSGSDKEKEEELIKVFRENDLLADISQVPLLFVMFAHLLQEEPELERHQSITAFYSYLIKCFRGHMKNKEPSKLKGSRTISKEDKQLRLKMGKVAFEGLVSNNQTLIWSKDTLVSALDNAGYEHYKNVGILVEEEVLKDYHTKGQHLHDTVDNEVTGRFFHKTVQEYYAAHYLVNLTKDKDGTKINKYLENLNPKDVVYFFLFTCGLEDQVANFVIDFLLNVEKRHGHRLGLKPSILAVNEIGDLNKLKECISKVCAKGITIETTNSTRHLQRASFKLIQTASQHEIPVEVIQLDDLFGSVNTGTGNIETVIGLHLPRLRFVKQLHLRDNGREWTGDEFQNILLYASSCDGLECITFSNCMVPLDVNDSTSLPNGISTKISVRWNSPHHNILPCELYLDPFRWEVRRGSTERPVSGYQEELLLQPEYEWLENEFRRLYRDSKWQKTHISTHPDNRNCVEDETLFELSCEIKDEWRAFAARLRISKILINAISSSSTDNTPQGKAYKMLSEWKILMKEHASPQVLERALRGASKDNLIDKLYHASLEGIKSHKVTSLIGGKGGVVTLGDTGVELHIPPEAFHDQHKIHIRILPHYLFDEPATCFEDHTTVMVDISPYDLRLQLPASLFLPHCLQLTDFDSPDVQVFNCYRKPDQKPLWEEVTKSVSFSLSEFGCKIEMERFCSVKYTVRGDGVEAKRLKLYAMGEKCNENAEYVTVNIGCHPALPGENKVKQRVTNVFKMTYEGCKKWVQRA